MASLKDIKYKVVAIQKTKQITRAMNMVSTAKLRSAQRNAEQFARYRKEYDILLYSMLRMNPEYTHPLLHSEGMSSDVGVIFITPDRGLCGAFSVGLIQRFQEFYTQHVKKGNQVYCYCLGRKGYDAVKKTDCNIIGYDIGTLSSITFRDIQKIAHTMQSSFTEGKIGGLYLIYGHFISLLSQESAQKQVLPIIPHENEGESDIDVIYEPNSIYLLDTILPSIVEITIYDAVLDTIVSEHAARMIAMNNATKNCDDLIASFSRLYNKVRQAAVTKELMDIVGGAEALNS